MNRTRHLESYKDSVRQFLFVHRPRYHKEALSLASHDPDPGHQVKSPRHTVTGLDLGLDRGLVDWKLMQVQVIALTRQARGPGRGVLRLALTEKSPRTKA